MEKLGIEELKSVVSLGIALGEFVDHIADGLGLSDVPSGIKLVRHVPGAVAAIKSKKVLPELKDLDEAEKAELKSFIKTEFDIKDDELEIKIESALFVVIDLADLLKVV